MNTTETLTWIPVTERLPDNNKDVLIDFGNGEVWVGRREFGQWTDVATWAKVRGVVAWAEMPGGVTTDD